MKKVICFFLCVLSIHAWGLKGHGIPPPEGPGGDVLRPSRVKPSTSVWYIGLDGGLTYSTFQDGPVSYSSPNPHHSIFPLESTIATGAGVGFHFNGTVDYEASERVGIVGRIFYQTRFGSFDKTNDLMFVHQDTQTGLNLIMTDNVDWTFTYLGFDLLLRLQLLERSFYFIGGPSFGSLLSNTAKLTQRIVQPDDIYYTQEFYVTNPYENKLVSASSETEIKGLNSTKFDLKAGFGTWIELSPGIYLTPEATISYPLTKLIESISTVPQLNTISNRTIGSTFFPVEVVTDKNFNVITFLFTVGLRWTMK